MQYLKKIVLSNFRSTHLSHINFENNITNIYSPNGSGKTSILEAIFLLNSSNSFHKIPNKNLIKYNTDEMSTCYQIYKEETHYDIKSTFIRSNSSINRKIYIEDKKTNLIAISQIIKISYFIPQMFTFFTHFPEQRRNFIDRLSFLRLEKEKSLIFIQNIKKYNQLADERQKILKNNISHSSLIYLETEMIRIFIHTMQTRINTIIILQKSLLELENEDLPGLMLNIQIKLPQQLLKKLIITNPSMKILHPDSDEINNNKSHTSNILHLNNLITEISSPTAHRKLEELLKDSRYLDSLGKSPSINLGLFELVTINKANNINIRYCSTGEQKMALITLLIAQKGDILLLDEISSFLDSKNYIKIWKILSKQKAQIISTSTTPLLNPNIHNLELQK